MNHIIQKIKKEARFKKYILIIGIPKKLYMFLCNRMIGINDKKVVFISFGGKSYSDNPKAISEKLYEICPDFEIVWLFNNPKEKREFVPKHIKCVKNNSLKALKELATAKIWIDNFCKPVYMYKGKKQIYIQTWHGDRGFKKILYDSTFITNKTKYIEANICDLMISGSNFANKIYKTAFSYNGKFMKKGCPRNDVFIKNDITLANKIRKILNIDPKLKILLYAPTLRREASDKKENQSLGDIDLHLVLNILEKKTGETWICFLRAHTEVAGLSGIPQEHKFIDVSLYEDMNDLLLISDILITDYSSSAGDFALLNRPIILFQSDRKVFMEKDRTFYFDMDKSPYFIAKSQNELINIIDGLDKDLIYKNCNDILKFYGTNETGKSSEEIVRYIISKTNTLI